MKKFLSLIIILSSSVALVFGLTQASIDEVTISGLRITAKSIEAVSTLETSDTSEEYFDANDEPNKSENDDNIDIDEINRTENIEDRVVDRPFNVEDSQNFFMSICDENGMNCVSELDIVDNELDVTSEPKSLKFILKVEGFGVQNDFGEYDIFYKLNGNFTEGSDDLDLQVTIDSFQFSDSGSSIIDNSSCTNRVEHKYKSFKNVMQYSLNLLRYEELSICNGYESNVNYIPIEITFERPYEFINNNITVDDFIIGFYISLPVKYEMTVDSNDFIEENNEDFYIIKGTSNDNMAQIFTELPDGTRYQAKYTNLINKSSYIYNWEIQLSAEDIDKNTKTLTIYATDNKPPFNNWLTKKYEIQTQQPRITVDKLQTNEIKPTLSGKVNGDDVIVEVELKDVRNNTYTYTADVNELNNIWTVDVLDNLSDGEFDIIATAKDKFDNSEINKLEKGLYIDTTAPQIIKNNFDQNTGKFEFIIEDKSELSQIYAKFQNKKYQLSNNEIILKNRNNNIYEVNLIDKIEEITKSGNYALNISAKDSLGNSNQKQFNINILKQENIIITFNNKSPYTNIEVDILNGRTYPQNTTVFVTIKDTTYIAENDGNQWKIPINDKNLSDGKYNIEINACNDEGCSDTIKDTIEINNDEQKKKPTPTPTKKPTPKPTKIQPINDEPPIKLDPKPNPNPVM